MKKKQENVLSVITDQFPPKEFEPFLNYAKKVRARFQYQQPEKFNSFISIVKETLVLSGVSLDGVQVGMMTDGSQDFGARVKGILEGDTDLIYEFNSIMPPCYQISLDDGEKRETVGGADGERSGFQDAMDFLEKVRIECGVDVYEKLLESLSLFKNGCRDLVDFFGFGHRVMEGHPYLQKEFLKFMPVFVAEPLSYHPPGLQSSELDNSRVDEQEKRGPENIQVCEKNDMETKSVREGGSEDQKGNSLDVEKETVAATESKTIGFREAIDFVKKLRIKCGEDSYERFLKKFRLCKNEAVDIADVRKLGLRLIKGHPDLQDEFLKFMPITNAKSLACHVPYLQSSNPTNIRVDEQQKRSPETEFVMAEADQLKGDDSISRNIREGLGLFEKVRKSLPCEVNYNKLLKILFYYSKGKIGKTEFKSMVRTFIGEYPDLMGEFCSFLRNCEIVSELDVRGSRKIGRREKHRDKSIEELDLSSCARCSPSYLLVPEEYQQSMTTHESQVLNNGKIISISRVMDKPFKHRKPNYYERNIFSCEDEQYELDMLVEWFRSADMYAKKLGRGTLTNEEKTGRERVFLRCIERLYGDDGEEVLETVHEHPQRALPVLRIRLKEKLAELIDYRNSLKSRRAEVYAANYRRSLERQKC